jgi:hypothetical protein
MRKADFLARCPLAWGATVRQNDGAEVRLETGCIMAKAFSTVKLLKGKEPFLRRMVCEVRFQDGQLYLDHTGRLLKKLVQDEAWVVSPQPTTAGTAVFHLVKGLQLSFSMSSASLDLDRGSAGDVIDPEEAAEFITSAEETLGFVVDQLEATRFERLGFRQWYNFSFESKEETELWLRDLGLFSVSPSLLGSFEATPEAMGVSFVMRGQECDYRIALNGVERAAQLPMGDTSLNIRASAVSEKSKKALLEAMKQKRQRQINSSFAVELDLDAYRKEPQDLEIAHFLGECVRSNLERFRDSLAKEDGKKGK